MTTGYICDRCGAAFESGGKWLYSGYSGSHAVMQHWDLCPDCMEGFAKWMDCDRESVREHSLESESMREQPESVRERRYESQGVTGSAERVTEAPELLHVDDGGQIADMSVKTSDCVRDGGEMSELEHDTREKLEADVRKHYAYSTTTLMYPPSANKTTDMLSALPVDTVIGWLDRQAAITEREWMAYREVLVRENCDQVDALTTELDNLRIYRDTWECTAHLHEKDIERLVEERDQWKDAYRDSESMRLELVEQVEYHEALIARLKQRRGELMEQVRSLQDAAAHEGRL